MDPLTQWFMHISSALVRSKSPRKDIRKRTSTWTRNASADLNTTYIHSKLESIPRCPTAQVMKLLIIIRGRRRTEGLTKEMGESGEIMRALEKELSKWRGFDDIGWMDEVGP